MDLFFLYVTTVFLSLFALFLLFYSRRTALAGSGAQLRYSPAIDEAPPAEVLTQQVPTDMAQSSEPTDESTMGTEITSPDREYLATCFEKINKLFLEHGSDSNINQLALSQICKQVNCLQAALYTSNDQKEILTLNASYGITKKADREVVQHGSGQVGQVLLDNESIIIRNIPKGYIQITSGLGATEPVWIGIFPLSFKGKAYGVLEMCFLHPESEAVRGFLERVSEVFGAHLFNQNVIVEQTQLEQLQQEKLKSEAILEGCVDGFIGFNREGIIDFCNRSAAELMR